MYSLLQPHSTRLQWGRRAYQHVHGTTTEMSRGLITRMHVLSNPPMAQHNETRRHSAHLVIYLTNAGRCMSQHPPPWLSTTKHADIAPTLSST
eukprot:1145347-Pelagomonas_calceolata.AAC.2